MSSKHPLYNHSGLQRENKSHILYALANKQMELKRIQEEYEAKITKLRSDLSALETTICLFDGNCSETLHKLNHKVKRTSTIKRDCRFEKGELKKLVLSILRTSSTPLKTDQITKTIMEDKGMAFENEREFINIQKTILYQLKKSEDENLTFRTGKDGLNFLWKIRD